MQKNYAIMRFKKYSSLSTAVGSERHGMPDYGIKRNSEGYKDPTAYTAGP